MIERAACNLICRSNTLVYDTSDRSAVNLGLRAVECPAPGSTSPHIDPPFVWPAGKSLSMLGFGGYDGLLPRWDTSERTGRSITLPGKGQ